MTQTSLEGLTGRNHLLELERDGAKLRAETAAFQIPWWRRGAAVTGLVTAVTTIISSAVGVTSVYNSKVQASKEVALKETAQANEITMSIQKVNDQIWSQYVTNGALYSRQRALRFILGTTPYDALRRWARQETDLVNDEINLNEAKIRGLEEQIDRSSAQTKEAQSKLAEMRAVQSRLVHP